MYIRRTKQMLKTFNIKITTDDTELNRREVTRILKEVLPKGTTLEITGVEHAFDFIDDLEKMYDYLLDYGEEESFLAKYPYLTKEEILATEKEFNKDLIGNLIKLLKKAHELQRATKSGEPRIYPINGQSLAWRVEDFCTMFLTEEEQETFKKECHKQGIQWNVQ